MSDVTNYPRQSYYRATLLSAIDSVQTDGIILSKQLEAISGTIYLNLLDVDNVETISCTGQDSNGELTGVTRAVATYSGETATASAHGAGISIVLSDDWNYWKDMVTGLNDKVDIGGDTMTGALKFSGSSNAGIEPNRLTTAQRTALSLTGSESAIVFDTDLGQYFTWNGSSWSEVSTGTAPAFASETVAGIVELSTAAQSLAGDSAGETGARLVMPNSLNVTTSAGAADAGKNPVLDANGLLNTNMIDASPTSSADVIVQADGSGKIDEGFLQMTDAQATVLTDGSDVSSYHTHDDTTLGLKSIAETPTYYLTTIPMVDVFTETSQTNTYRGSFANSAPSADVTNSSITTDAIYFMNDAVLAFSSGKQVIVEFEAVFRNGNTSEQGGFGLATAVAPFSDYDDATVAAATFSFQSTDLIYAHTSTGAGGAAHTETQLSGVDIFAQNIYRIVFNPGTNVLFYVNGSLKATHTTNLPAAGTIKFGWGSDGSDGNYISKISPITIRVER